MFRLLRHGISSVRTQRGDYETCKLSRGKIRILSDANFNKRNTKNDHSKEDQDKNESFSNPGHRRIRLFYGPVFLHLLIVASSDLDAGSVSALLVRKV